MDLFFNLYKIKFTLLDELLNNVEIDLSKEANVYINLEPIIRKTTKYMDKELRIKSKERIIEFISCVINLASHYRLYFSRKRVFSRVYIYLGYPFNINYINNDIYNNYRNNYISTFMSSETIGMKNILEESIPLIKTICEFIDGVYFIESGNIEPSLIPMIVNESLDSKNTNNFIVTSDKYEYQYSLKDFYILRPKQKNSYILYSRNIINQMMIEEKMIPNSELNQNIIPFILSILGNDYRSIPKLKGMGFKTIIKAVNKGIQMGIISDKVNNIFILSKIIKDEFHETLFLNYLLTDLDSQYKKIKDVDKYNIIYQLKDKFDNKGLKEMNDNYFSYYPLNIIEIMSSCKYKNKNKKLNLF